MTVIAVKNGQVAADSRYNIESESGGIRMFQTEKLFRKRVTLPNSVEQDVIICTAGEGPPGLVFVDWFGSNKEPPDLFVHGDADFTVLVVMQDGTLMEYDKWCRGEKVFPTKGCYAIGCGAKAAMGAMLAGASAKRAVEITIEIDQLCGPPVVTMQLPKPARKKKAKSIARLVPGSDGPLDLSFIGHHLEKKS
jgi:hypothetical protein